MQLLEAVKAAAPSRIINLASTAHLRGKINFEDFNSSESYDAAAAYNQSKLANVLFTRELSRKLKGDLQGNKMQRSACTDTIQFGLPFAILLKSK